MATIKKDEQLYDTRLVDRNVRNGLIKVKDFEKYLKSLENSEGNSEYIHADDIFEELRGPEEVQEPKSKS